MMCVNRIPFSLTKSEGINLRISTCMLQLTKKGLTVAIQELVDVYQGRGFRIRHTYTDMQFECIKDEFEGVEVEIVDADDRVEEIERAFRKAKEGMRVLV